MTTTPEAARLAEELRKAASEIRAAGHNGWGNACSDAADFLAALSQPDEARDAQWQPIEGAPKGLGPILLWLPPVGGWLAGAWRGSWSFSGECWTLHTPLMQDGKSVCLTGNPEPTHWMPMPDAPAAAMSKEQP